MTMTTETPTLPARNTITTIPVAVPPIPPIDSTLQRHRENVTSNLAYLVVLLFAAAMVGAFVYLKDNEFDRVKDILSMLTPILGMVLGFYFNKSSTEGRAESAEQSAKLATHAAQKAETDAATAIDEISSAAEEYLGSGGQFPEPVDDAGYAGGHASGSDAARIRLEEAIKRAKRRR